MVRVVGSLAVGVALMVGFAVAAQERGGEKKEKGATKSGKVVGILVANDKKSIDVKADGEEKPRKYVPHWRGGPPDQGGGPDKKMLKIIAELKVGSRVEVEWEFEERLRVVGVRVLQAPKKEEKD